MSIYYVYIREKKCLYIKYLYYNIYIILYYLLIIIIYYIYNIIKLPVYEYRL